MNSTLIVLTISLLVVLVTARPQLLLPKLIQYAPDSNMLRTTSRPPFKLSTPKPVPHKAHTKGGAVINLPSGVVLKAGAELTNVRGGEDNTLSYNNDGFNNVVNNVAGGVLEQGGAEFEYAPNFALPSNIDQKLVYVKSPNSDQQIVYVLVPVNSTTATKTPVSNGTATDENTAGILKFVPPTLKRFFHHFITLRKSFHFFNIFVNSNLYSTT